MPIVVQVPKPIKWSDKKLRSLPNLRLPEHTEGHDDSKQGGEGWHLPLFFRCRHGVYLTEDPTLLIEPTDDGEGWEIRALYCDVCAAEFEWHEKRPSKLIRRRPLESGEYRYSEQYLFDRRKVYPEIFTKPIRISTGSKTKLKLGPIRTDLRLQIDYETGERKLETMGGYRYATLGYGDAPKGHGPDMDVDDIRMSVLEGTEGLVGSVKEIGAPAVDLETPWLRCTMPRVIDGVEPPQITKENWIPAPLPLSNKPPKSCPTGEFALDLRTSVGRTKENGVWGPPVILPTVPERWKLDQSRYGTKDYVPPKSDSALWLGYQRNRITGQNWLAAECSTTRWWERPKPAESGCGFLYLPEESVPTTKQLAVMDHRQYPQGQKSRPYKRVLRDWPADWRTQRKMVDLAANLKMYARGSNVTTDPEAEPEPQDRVLTIARMRETTYENYQKARLAMATNHGKVGFWRQESRGNIVARREDKFKPAAPCIYPVVKPVTLFQTAKAVAKRRAEIDPIEYERWLHHWRGNSNFLGRRSQGIIFTGAPAFVPTA